MSMTLEALETEVFRLSPSDRSRLLEHLISSLDEDEEMEAAWEEIKSNTAVTLTIDLFFIGLVFLNPDFKVKQHFVIRF